MKWQFILGYDSLGILICAKFCSSKNSVSCYIIFESSKIEELHQVFVNFFLGFGRHFWVPREENRHFFVGGGEKIGPLARIYTPASECCQMDEKNEFDYS